MPDDVSARAKGLKGAVDNRAILSLFTVFHLNLAFSSIQEDRYEEVITSCYWPLLKLAEKHKVGIEVNARTLEVINALDPRWVESLRATVAEGQCEFIASGYVQMISPLVPWQMTARNLRYGQEVYERLLGERPRVALLNEQAYAPGLIELYEEAGFDAFIMEWGNPASQHPEWPSDWRYYPQRATGQAGESLPVIWNDSIAFQKFQRYVFGELDLDEILDHLDGQKGDAPRAFSLYGNDAEIFDFRPGRFETEPERTQAREWDRIDKLFDCLDADPRFELVTPSSILSLMVFEKGGNAVSMESPGDPIPVKKQPKYNVCRWAVSGRDDLWANTVCWRLFGALSNAEHATDDDWRQLCRLWQSDFRTHVTDRKWDAFQEDLRRASEKWLGSAPAGDPFPVQVVAEEKGAAGGLSWRRQRRCLVLEGDAATVRLNLNRGLAIDGFRPAGEALDWFGTLDHGFYDHIGWSNDYYSGHLVAQIIGQRKITDLEPVEATLLASEDGRFVDVQCTIGSGLGLIHKTVRVYADQAKVTIRYRLDWGQGFIGSLRAGFVTLNPHRFDRRSLSFRSNNGGRRHTRHDLSETDVDHAATWSFMMSTRGGTGMTDGQLVIGDAERRVVVDCPRETAAMIGLLSCASINGDDDYFCRLTLSARELDDTSQPGYGISCEGRNVFEYSITASRTDDET